MNTAESIGHKKKANIDKIKKEIPVFEQQVEGFRDKLKNPKYLDISNNLDAMLTQMEELEKECADLVATSKKYQEWQMTLDMEVNQFVKVDEARQEVKDRISLWNAIKDWQIMVNGWVNAPFESIDTDTISQEAEKYTKIVIR